MLGRGVGTHGLHGWQSSGTGSGMGVGMQQVLRPAVLQSILLHPPQSASILLHPPPSSSACLRLLSSRRVSPLIAALLFLLSTFFVSSCECEDILDCLLVSYLVPSSRFCRSM